MIKLAPGISLPLEIVTQTIAIIARKRMGKSFLARKLGEELLKAGQQIVIVDPKGDHWGIRSAADGKHPGLPVVILGGEHGDVPLDPGAGEIVAKLVVEERVSVLLDLSLPRKHEVATFMAAFLENLYRLKAREIYRTPVMLIIDEADAIAPQHEQRNEARMLGAAQDIVRRGGQRGIGCTMVTQRSAVLSKDVLTQAQMLVVLRTIAPQDLKAMQAWIDVHGTAKQRDTLMESLPSLGKGDAWFWSPGWPDDDGIFKRAHVSPIETFDSGATPEPGKKRVEPKNLADVDLDALRRQMASTIERAKADDPRVLRKRIAELEKQVIGHTRVEDQNRIADLEERLSNAMRARPSKVVEKPVIKAEQIARLEKTAQHLKNVSLDVQKHVNDISAALDRVQPAALGRNIAWNECDGAVSDESGSLAARTRRVDHPVPRPPRVPARPAHAVFERKPNGALPGDMTKPQQRMLDVLATFEAIGVTRLSRSNLAAFSKQTSTSSAYDRQLAAARKSGWLEYGPSSTVMLTDEGRLKAEPSSSPPTLAGLHDAWRAQLTEPQVRMLDELIAVYPRELTKEDLAEKARQNPTSSAYDRNLALLRGLGIADYPTSNTAAATSLLFPEGLT